MTLPPLTPEERARNLAKMAIEPPGGGLHYMTQASRDVACGCPIGKRHDEDGVLRPFLWPAHDPAPFDYSETIGEVK